jgi:hypothetical protein
VRVAAVPPHAQHGEGDHPKGGGGVNGSAHPYLTGHTSAFYPSTMLRPAAAAQPVPALGMPPACRPAYTPLPIPDGEEP